MTRYKVDRPRKKPLLIATGRDEDKIWLVGESNMYGHMVTTIMLGIEDKHPRPLVQLYKWIDADEWEWLNQSKWSEEET